MPKAPQSPPYNPIYVTGGITSGADAPMSTPLQNSASVQGGFTPTNVLLPVQPQDTPTISSPTRGNGFTPSNVTQPVPQPKPAQGTKDPQ